jgi:HEAT repeat protein
MDLLDDSDARVRAAALVAVISVRAPLEHVLPRIEAAMKDASPLLRSAAVQAAVRLGDDGKTLRSAVVAALKDKDASVRDTVLSLLGPDFGDAVPTLTPMLDDRTQRTAALAALGRIGAPAKSAVPKLIALLGSGAKEDRLNVLAAVSQLGAVASEARPALEAARKDKDDAIRTAAFTASAAITSDNRARLALLTAGLDDPERAIRQAAATGLAPLGERALEAVPKLLVLAASDGDREFAVSALQSIPVRDVPMLIGLLEQPHRELQLYACQRLERLKYKASASLPKLGTLAASRDTDVASAARRAIKAIK